MDLDVSDRGQLDLIIKQTLNFFGKTVNRDAMEIWEQALENKRLDDIQRAFKLHIKKGRYAPVPADILGYISEFNEQRRGSGIVLPMAENPITNDRMIELAKGSMDAKTFDCFMELVFHVLNIAPDFVLKKLAIKLAYTALQVSKGYITMATAKTYFKGPAAQEKAA